MFLSFKCMVLCDCFINVVKHAVSTPSQVLEIVLWYLTMEVLIWKSYASIWFPCMKKKRLCDHRQKEL